MTQLRKNKCALEKDLCKCHQPEGFSGEVKSTGFELHSFRSGRVTLRRLMARWIVGRVVS